MTFPVVLKAGAACAFCLACLLSPPIARADDGAAAQLTGTWRIEAADLMPLDGGRAALYGPSPIGLLMLDKGGYYSLQVRHSAAQESDAHFGRYSVDTDGRILTFRAAAGDVQARRFSLLGDSLLYVVPAPTGDPDSNGIVQWRRVR